tara:strand:- start:12 stop:266 length:255 start_codon:yes stop_codon:yes gene_type:complete
MLSIIKINLIVFSFPFEKVNKGNLENCNLLIIKKDKRIIIGNTMLNVKKLISDWLKSYILSIISNLNKITAQIAIADMGLGRPV